MPLPSRGVIYTFYSYKGGVGRSMALANVGALLAGWGHRVLLVDFDIEAPGLERFFGEPAVSQRAQRPGLVDLLLGLKHGQRVPLGECLIDIALENATPTGRLALLSAGRDDTDYLERVQQLDWPELFDNYAAGDFMLDLREECIDRTAANGFDFVLIDSRTGVTDIGSICTALLPDDLILLFTTAEQSYKGVLNVADRASVARAKIPRDLPCLRCLPLPTRDEATTEWGANRAWRTKFANAFDALYRTWLPKEVTPLQAMNKLHVPYVPVWSFGECLPVLSAPDEIAKPGTIGSAYARLATLLLHRFDWGKLESRITAHELEEERRAARSQIKLATDRAADAQTRLKQFQYIAAALLGLFIVVAGREVWNEWRGKARATAEHLLEDSIKEMTVSQRFALIAELGRFPEPVQWRTTFREVWDAPVPRRVIRAREGGSIRAASLGPRTARIAWTSAGHVFVEDSNGTKLAQQELPWRATELEWSTLENRLVVRSSDGAALVLALDAPGLTARLESEKGRLMRWGAAEGAEVLWAILGSAENQLMVLDPRLVAHSHLFADEIDDVKISPDGRLICATTSAGVTCLSIEGAPQLKAHELLTGELEQVSNWGAIVRNEGRLSSWLLPDGKLAVPSDDLPTFVHGAFDESGGVLAWTEKLEVYRVEPGRFSRTTTPAALLPSPNLSKNGVFYSAGQLRNLWGKSYEPVDFSGTAPHVSADGQLVVFKSSAGRVIERRLGDGGERLLLLRNGPTALAVSETGRWVAAGYWKQEDEKRSSSIEVLDRRSSQVSRITTASDVNALVISELDEGIVVARTDEGLVAWKVASRQLLRENSELEGFPLRIFRGQIGLSVALDTPALWSLSSDSHFAAALDSGQEVVAVSEHGAKFLAVDEDAGIAVVDLLTGNKTALGGGPVTLLKVADGRRVLLSYGNEFLLMQVEPTGWQTIARRTGAVVAFSPALDLVLSRTPDGIVPTWFEAPKTEQVPLISGDDLRANFNHDGSWLALSGPDGASIFAVDGKTHKLHPHPEMTSPPGVEMPSFGFSRDGRVLLARDQVGDCESVLSFRVNVTGRIPLSIATLAKSCRHVFERSRPCENALDILARAEPISGTSRMNLTLQLNACRIDPLRAAATLELEPGTQWATMPELVEEEVLGSSGTCLLVGRQRHAVELWCSERARPLDTSSSWKEAVSEFRKRSPECLSPRLRGRLLDMSESDAEKEYKECEDARRRRPH